MASSAHVSLARESYRALRNTPKRSCQTPVPGRGRAVDLHPWTSKLPNEFHGGGEAQRTTNTHSEDSPDRLPRWAFGNRLRRPQPIGSRRSAGRAEPSRRA